MFWKAREPARAARFVIVAGKDVVDPAAAR